MFGLEINVVCPNCNQSLGCSTGYYKIDESEREYTKCTCYLCGSKYWLHHSSDAIDVRKVTGEEKLKQTAIICW